ncbi:MAG TPA: cobalamin-dependent protein, partial [Wenzhouxiangella sp.]|nr:cobalamin-dependent protein [Wenzhouxiangella sp.]
MSQTAKPLANTPRAEFCPPLRVVTAASLFDGHDAAINLMRRLIQGEGCEVIHLGHNRAVAEIVRAAICEDADAIAVSSYQGGHMEYFRYMVDMLEELGAGHVQVFGGGGGTITPAEIRELQDYGVARIYHPDDGMKMGLKDMIGDLVERARQAREERQAGLASAADEDRDSKGRVDVQKVAHQLSAIENGNLSEHELARLRQSAEKATGVPIVGLTGTGGAGKSSVTDELLNRFLQYFP